MNKVNIVIQNGHRNASGGQTGTGGELDLIDKVFGVLTQVLQQAGVVVYYDDANLTNTKTLGDSLMYFVALHFDGAINPAYDGGFVDDSPNDLVASQSWDFARTVADNYFIPMGIRFAPEHRSVNSTYYYAFNYTGADTKQFLIELGTLTNAHDKDVCQDFSKIATLLAKGILEYFKTKDQVYQAYLAETLPPPVITPQTNPCQTYIDQIQSVKNILYGKGFWWTKINNLKAMFPK